MPPRRRLNLFAFPPETNALFNLLILAAITLAQFLGNAFGVIFGFWDTLSSVDFTIGLESTKAYLPFIFVSVLIILAVLGIAYFFYLRHPAEIRKRRKIRSISEKDQIIQEQVNQLSRHAGIASPQIEMPPVGLRGTDAQAFGVGKAQKIGLDGGFRILRKTKPDLFNALLHHELAHFANGDIGRSYFSDALWKSFRWVIVLPFILGLIGRFATVLFINLRSGNLQPLFEIAQYLFPMVMQFILVFVAAAALWARLLRTREYYADWRAILWGSQDPLKKIFEEEDEAEKRTTYFKVINFHPNSRERIDAIEHPEILFNLSPMLVFLTGLLLSFLFFGLYFSLAAFLVLSGVLQEIRDLSAGLAYWLIRGLLWFGIVLFFVFVFGSIAWLMNSVLLPQIQKQAIVDLLNKQRGWMGYAKLLLTSLMLVTGIELGFFILPFGFFVANDLWGLVLEFAIIVPVIIFTALWYLIYIRFLSVRLCASQTGEVFSVWRRRFLSVASTLWAFLFFIPGIFLTRFLSGELLQVFLYATVFWLIFTVICSVIVFIGSWAIIKLFFDNQPKKCPHCGKITSHTSPAIELCEHCEGVLGEWLFVPEQIQIP